MCVYSLIGNRRENFLFYAVTWYSLNIHVSFSPFFFSLQEYLALKWHLVARVPGSIIFLRLVIEHWDHFVTRISSSKDQNFVFYSWNWSPRRVWIIFGTRFKQSRVMDRFLLFYLLMLCKNFIPASSIVRKSSHGDNCNQICIILDNLYHIFDIYYTLRSLDILYTFAHYPHVHFMHFLHL